MRRLALAFLLLLAAPFRAEAQVLAEQLRMRTAAQLSALTPMDGATRRRVYICSDCASSASCTAGGGSTENICKWTGSGWAVVGSGTGAPTGAQYLTLALDAGLSAERTFAAGLMLSAVDGGANGAYTLNLSGSSANLATALSDETGTGAVVLAGSPALTGDPTVNTASVCLENGTNCPGGGVGTVEYSPDNYPPAAVIHASQTDEFTNDTPSLTWTQRNPSTATFTYRIDGLTITTNSSATDEWHGVTAPMTDDTADWWMVAKIHYTLVTAATRGCGISIITEGTAAAPSEINTIYLRSASASAASFEFLSHDDYDFSPGSSIATHAVYADTASVLAASAQYFWVMLQWIAATDDIQSYWSFDGIGWRTLGPDTTVGTDGPVAIGLFSRDDISCTFDYVRTFTDIDGASNVGVEIGS